MTADTGSKPLNDLVEDIIDRRGVTPLKLGSNFTASGYRVISAKSIKDGEIVLGADEPRFVDEPTYRRWMRTPLSRDDVILTSEAPLGEVAYVREPLEWCVGQRLFCIRTRKSELHGRFLYYALQTEAVRHDLLSRATGTTAQGIRQSELRKVHIPVPPLVNQHAVAELLGALDDKIDLNRRMNATLEATARALFGAWFIDFEPVRAKAEGRPPDLPQPIAELFSDRFEESKLGMVPEGWWRGTLGDIADHPRRGTPPEELTDGRPYIALEHMPKRSIVLAEWGTSDGVQSGKFQFKRKEILFGKLRPYFHKVGVAPVDGVCSTDIVVVRPRADEWFGVALGTLSSDAFVEHTSAGSTGTKMPRTSWGEMARYPLAVPPIPVARAFSDYVEPMIDRILASIHENRTLGALREALLPKLISGEIRPSEAERILEATQA